MDMIGKPAWWMGALSAISLLLLVQLGQGGPSEFTGNVTQVIDGDSIFVTGIGWVRLADIDAYQIPTQKGTEAKHFTQTHLLHKRIYLDLDDKKSSCPKGCTIAVAYLADGNGTINPVPYNRMLVDAGLAVVHDRPENEFDPLDWWP